MTQMVNLTPHDVNFVDQDGKILVTIPASGTVARVSTKSTEVGGIMMDGDITVPIHGVEYGEVIGLPPYDENKAVYYLVSGMVAAAIPYGTRRDICIPDDFVRDEGGRIIGARGVRLA